MRIPQYNIADVLSMFPGTQQVVGLGTVASNLVKLVGDLGKKILGKKTDFKQHAKFIGIGIIRAIPIAGTAYSVSKIWNARKEHKRLKGLQVIVHPRAKELENEPRKAANRANQIVMPQEMLQATVKKPELRMILHPGIQQFEIGSGNLNKFLQAQQEQEAAKAKAEAQQEQEAAKAKAEAQQEQEAAKAKAEAQQERLEALQDESTIQDSVFDGFEGL